MRKRVTPPRPVDVGEWFPELAAYRREAVRLHPRPGDPGVRESSVGGPLLWPAVEEWPVCRSGGHVEDQPLVPVVQVWRRDVPGLAWPDGAEVLQVLWCPCDHAEDPWSPLPLVVWRPDPGAGPVAVAPGPGSEADGDCVPVVCAVEPEPVADHPSWDLPRELRAELWSRFDRVEAETGWSYWYHLSTVPGVKLGGWPGWTQEPLWPDCTGCGGRMSHLITVPSREADGLSWRSWLPDADLEPGERESGERRSEVSSVAVEGAGLTLGDMGGVYVFECLRCPGRPFVHRFDCS